MVTEYHYRWEYDLASPPEALWPLVADTNRFNRDTGLPRVEMLPSPPGAPRPLNARRRLRLKYLGMNVEWEEEPFQWVRPLEFGVTRTYATGPIRRVRMRA
ncbi:MAG: hypothetical protein HY719_12470, partial [Planctomycetes bacterium]|nr:hypothetical protein [Planctomycetota bacterium]